MASEQQANNGYDSLKSMNFKEQRKGLMPQIVVRGLAIVFTLVAIFVMVTASQTIDILGFKLYAKYSASASFKFLVGANAVTCACSALSFVYVCVLSYSGSHVRDYFLMFLHDLVILLLMMSGFSAAAAIGYVGKYGESAMGWVDVCSDVGKFCHTLTISMAFSFLALFTYFILTVMAARKLKSQDAQ